MPDEEAFSPLPLEGADERSEAGLASPRVKYRFESQPPPLRGTSFQRKEGEKMQGNLMSLGLAVFESDS